MCLLLLNLSRSLCLLLELRLLPGTFDNFAECGLALGCFLLLCLANCCLFGGVLRGQLGCTFRCPLCLSVLLFKPACLSYPLNVY